MSLCNVVANVPANRSISIWWSGANPNLPEANDQWTRVAAVWWRVKADDRRTLALQELKS